MLALEEEGQHAGANMGAGEGFVGADDEFLRFPNGAEFFRQGLCLVQAIAVGDEQPLHLALGQMVGVELGQCLQRLLPAADLAAGGDMSGGVAPEDGLDIQHGADGGGGAVDPAGGFQKVQIIHGEEVQGVHHFRVQDLSGIPGGFALVPKLRGTDGQQAGAEAGTQGVHQQTSV